MTLHLIGYWGSEPRSGYPDPHDLIDEAWDEEQRWVVASYLDTGTYLRGALGLSPCRICAQPNGSGEYTDGTLAWPEGLAHYVREHSVRLPASIEEHILRAFERLQSEALDQDWWAAGSPSPIP